MEPHPTDLTLVESLELAVGGRQVIPRPAGAYLGQPAPWDALDPGARRGLTLERVRHAVLGRQEEVPRSGPSDPVTEAPSGALPSAVLVPLFEEGGETRVVLTRRAAHLRSHRGEVCFPGGRLEPGEGAEDAALREAAEEVGLRATSVTVAGRLSPLSTFVSGSSIVPVVGFLPGRPQLAPNPEEVEHPFDVALADLLAPGVFREERWMRDGDATARMPSSRAGASHAVWFFELPRDTVWGATARILVELLLVVLGLPG